jgi:hypothetical protein
MAAAWWCEGEELLISTAETTKASLASFMYQDTKTAPILLLMGDDP